MNDQQIEAAARVIHEAKHAVALAMGDYEGRSWTNATLEERQAAKDYGTRLLNGDESIGEAGGGTVLERAQNAAALGVAATMIDVFEDLESL